MKLSKEQVETIANHISSQDPDEFNQVVVDISELGEKLELGYAQTKRALREACSRLGIKLSDNVVEITGMRASSSEEWADQRNEIARKLGLAQ